MPSWKSLFLFLLLVCSTLAIAACETTDLVRVAVSGSSGAAPTSAAQREPTKKPTRSPDAPYDFNPVGTPRCSVGDNAASIVKGRIIGGGGPIAGQKVQAASGPGAEPISDTPAESDEQGNFQVTFVCGGSACNGAFWVWLVNDDLEQVSPFIKFIFDDQCRTGSVNFSGK